MKKDRLFYWLPRGVAIGYILFLGLFALDIFIPGQTPFYYTIGFLIHLIPNFVLLAFLIIAWHWERLGAVLFGLAFLLMMAMFWTDSQWWMQAVLFSPLLITSGLFWFHNQQRKV